MGFFVLLAGGVVVLLGLIAVSDFLDTRRDTRASRRTSPQGLREHARVHASGRGVPGPRGGGPGAD